MDCVCNLIEADERPLKRSLNYQKLMDPPRAPYDTFLGENWKPIPDDPSCQLPCKPTANANLKPELPAKPLNCHVNIMKRNELKQSCKCENPLPSRCQIHVCHHNSQEKKTYSDHACEGPSGYRREQPIIMKVTCAKKDRVEWEAAETWPFGVARIPPNVKDYHDILSKKLPPPKERCCPPHCLHADDLLGRNKPCGFYLNVSCKAHCYNTTPMKRDSPCPHLIPIKVEIDPPEEKDKIPSLDLKLCK